MVWAIVYSGNSSGRACAARIHEEHGSSVALVRVFLTPRKGPVRRASRIGWEDRRRASAGGPRTFRPGRAGTATRSVRPVRVRGTPVFTQSHPGQQGIHKLPSFFNSKVWKGLLPALAGLNVGRIVIIINTNISGRKGTVVGQNQNAKPQGNGTGARKRFQRSRFSVVSLA